MTDLPVFEMERVFQAPRGLVWRTWTEPDLFKRWYGPNVETVIHRLQLRPGGLLLSEMRWSGGGQFERMEYVEVVAPDRLVWLHSMADADWNVATNPKMPDWPRRLLTTVTFAEAGEATRLRLTWAPHEATAAEIACFAGAIERLGMGWGAGFDLLADLLADLSR